MPPKLAETLGSKKFWVFVVVSALILYGAVSGQLSVKEAIEFETAAGAAYQLADGIHSGLQQMGSKNKPAALAPGFRLVTKPPASPQK